MNAVERALSLREAGPILAAAFRSNAQAIEACFELGYLDDEQPILDCTHGEGRWWRKRAPKHLVAMPRDLVADFRQLPFPPGAFARVAFDPPYVPPGGRRTSTIKSTLAAYGQLDMPKDPEQTQQLMDAGLAEIARLLPIGGLCFAKTKSYITGGRFHPQEYRLWKKAEACGLEVRDRLLVVQKSAGPQSQTTQEHFRNNFSTLFIFEKKRAVDERSSADMLGELLERWQPQAERAFPELGMVRSINGFSIS